MSMSLIETVEVGAGGAASIEFTSIPQDGTDLVLLVSPRCTTTDTNLRLSLNGSSASFNSRVLYGSNTTAISFTSAVMDLFTTYNGDTSNTFANNVLQISNYSGATTKSISLDAVRENNAAYAPRAIVAGLWSNTSAITSLGLAPTAGAIAQYSTASLYKITKG